LETQFDFTKTYLESPFTGKKLLGWDKDSIETATSDEGQIETHRKLSGFVKDKPIFASPTGAPKTGVLHTKAHERRVLSRNSRLRDPVSVQSSSKRQRTAAVGNIQEPVEEVKTKKSASTLSTHQQGDKQPESRVSLPYHGIPSGHQTTIVLRKRSRKPASAIDKSKLLKQKISGQGSITTDCCNKVVIRCNVKSVLDRSVGSIYKLKCGNENTSKSRKRWHYNGGLMINHRFEYCYYFVLHCNEEKKSLTIVPMIKNGVFEQATGSGNKAGDSTILDKRVLERPRYECNILETDKNWIRDVPMEDYVVVPEAVAVIDTSLVAHEAWDII